MASPLGQGRSVSKLIISLCVPPGGGEILKEALQGRVGEAHWLNRLPTHECARKPPEDKEKSLPCQTLPWHPAPTPSQVLLKSLAFPR